MGVGKEALPERASSAGAASATRRGKIKQGFRSDLFKTIMPSLIAIGALIVSFLAFADQHGVDQSAAISARQAYAAQVSWWLLPSRSKDHGFYLIIQNRGHTPIYNVTVYMNVGEEGSDANATPPVRVILRDDIIPPCATDTTRPLDAVIKNSNKNGKIYGSGAAFPTVVNSTVEKIAFTDVTGMTWYRSSVGNLSMGVPISATSSTRRPISDIGRIATIAGC